MQNSSANYQSRIEEVLTAQGFDHFGWSPLTAPVSLSIYDEWLKSGLHGEMQYLKIHRDKKADIHLLEPKAHSLISVAIPYFHHPAPSDALPKQLKVARYAQGLDYHHWFLTRLKEAAQELQSQFIQHEFLCFTDSQPLLEREWAWKSRLGWVGKNSMLIHPKKGSFFLLG